MRKMYKQVAPMQMLERVAPDNIKSLTALLEATQKLKTGLARVATRDLVRRVFSREALCLLRDLKSHLVRCSPVVAERIYDAFRGLLAMGWRDASLANVANVLLDVLGGTFVKMAQVLAHSPGLLPPSLVAACRSSLSNGRGRAVGPSEVRAAIEKSLGRPVSELFDAFDTTPLAVASIAQVHAATLAGSSEAVVVKLVRPGVRQRLSADLELCSILARFTDLLLGEAIVSDLLSSSLTHMVRTLADAILSETDLDSERQNMESFRGWLSTSPSIQRAGLTGAVVVPKVYPELCASDVLTMEAIRGPLLSECARKDEAAAAFMEGSGVVEDVVARAVDEAAASTGVVDNNGMPGWKRALSRALSVVALSLVEDGAIFHADLHMGNLIYLQESASMAFLDFGVCGSLPPWLRGALLLQALSFVVGDETLLAEGFGFAMRTRPPSSASVIDGPAAAASESAAETAAKGLQNGTAQLDVAALTAALRPLLAELEPINPFGAGASSDDAINPALYKLLAKGQLTLAEHGVQLPHEFTLLMKTAIFGCAHLSQYSTAEEIEVLSSDLSSAARSFALTNYSEIRTLLPPTATKQLVKQAAKHTASAAKRRLLNGSAKRKGKGYKSTIFPFVGALMLGLGLLTCALGVLMAVEPKAAAKITNSLTAGSVEWHTTGGAWSGMKTAPNVTAPQHMKQRRNKAEKVA